MIVPSRAWFWAQRALSILFMVFVTLFALGGESHGFWRTLVALLMHLISSFVMLAALVLAWRWEWVGTVMFLLHRSLAGDHGSN